MSENNNPTSTDTETKSKTKVTPSDIKTPFGSRQDLLDEFSRLIRELDDNQRIGKRKFMLKSQQKDLQASKELQPSLESDVDTEMPIDGDSASGSRVYMRYCASCHSLEASNQGRNAVMGPALGLIYGKKAGSDKYFNYSESYIKSKRTWTEKSMFKYLANPQREFPDSKCFIKGDGLKDEGERADVSKFLRLFSKNLKIFLNNKAKKTFGNEYMDTYQNAQRSTDQSAVKNVERTKRGEI